MTNPVLFLDVDGVLNTRATKPGADGVRDVELRPVNNPQTRYTGVLEMAKVRAVARAVEACGAKVVVSSSWRDAFADGAAFAATLGLAPPIASAPDLLHRDWRTGRKVSSKRCHEIGWWLEEHRRVKRYAVVDDHPVFPPDWEGAKHEVRTDARFGITNRDLDRIVGLLGKGEFAGRDWFADPPGAAAFPEVAA